MTAEPELLNVKEVAARLKVCRSTVRTILAQEKTGVHRICTPGSTRVIIRVEASVVERILRRSMP